MLASTVFAIIWIVGGDVKVGDKGRGSTRFWCGEGVGKGTGVLVYLPSQAER